MTIYNRIASVEFAIHGKDTRLKISNLPYIWNPREVADIDQAAVFEAITHLRSIGVTSGLSVICVTSSSA
jgi:hypothetical protein